MVLDPQSCPPQAATAEPPPEPAEMAAPTLRRRARLFAIRWGGAAFCNKCFPTFPFYRFASSLLRGYFFFVSRGVFFERGWGRLLCEHEVEPGGSLKETEAKGSTRADQSN